MVDLNLKIPQDFLEPLKSDIFLQLHRPHSLYFNPLCKIFLVELKVGLILPDPLGELSLVPIVGFCEYLG